MRGRGEGFLGWLWGTLALAAIVLAGSTAVQGLTSGESQAPAAAGSRAASTSGNVSAGNIHYTVDPSDAHRLDGVQFKLQSPIPGPAGTFWISLDESHSNSPQYSCSTPDGGTSWNCGTTSPQATVLGATQVTVFQPGGGGSGDPPPVPPPPGGGGGGSGGGSGDPPPTSSPPGGGGGGSVGGSVGGNGGSSGGSSGTSVSGSSGGGSGSSGGGGAPSGAAPAGGPAPAAPATPQTPSRPVVAQAAPATSAPRSAAPAASAGTAAQPSAATSSAAGQGTRFSSAPLSQRTYSAVPRLPNTGTGGLLNRESAGSGRNLGLLRLALLVGGAGLASLASIGRILGIFRWRRPVREHRSG